MSHRKDRERAEKGLLFRDGKLVNPKVADKMRSVGMTALKNAPTETQVSGLAHALHSGRLSPEKLRRELENAAPNEMRKGADKLIKENKAVTVDALLQEYRSDKEFKALAEEVGLQESYFVTLAEDEIYKRSIKDEPEPEKRNSVFGFFRGLTHGS